MDWLKKNLFFKRSKATVNKNENESVSRASESNVSNDDFVELVKDEKEVVRETGELNGLEGISCLLSEKEEEKVDIDVKSSNNNNTDNKGNPKTSSPRISKPRLQPQPTQSSHNKKKPVKQPLPPIRSCIIHQPK